MHFGEHVTVDGYGGDESLLNSESVVTSCLNDLPGLLGMKKLSTPVVYFAKGNDTKDPGGWTGMVVIEESHISIHTFPKRGFVSADVYTCKNGMDGEYIIQYFKEKFGLKDVESNFLKRGTRYPSGNIY
jgi:S-adenosylmethionine decarboxylase